MKFFSAAPGAVAGSVNPAELSRALFAALGVSGLAGLLALALNAVDADASRIFSPDVAPAASFAIGLVLDLLRRMQHAAPPKP